MALVTTTLGDMDESLLDRHEGRFENDIEMTTWTEYRLKGESAESAPIHRSVHVTLKEPIIADSAIGV